MTLIKLADGAAGLLWQAALMREAVFLPLRNLYQILLSLCFLVAFSTDSASSGVYYFQIFTVISANYVQSVVLETVVPGSLE